MEKVEARGPRAGTDGRTVRLGDGREVVSFTTSGYLGLDKDPRLVEGAVAAIERWGATFASSQAFVESALYAEAEAGLARVFGRPVVLAGSTTLAHAAALPVLLREDDVVFYDRQVHHSVQSALAAFGTRGPRRVMVPHNDLDALDMAVASAIAGGAKRVWYCADGIYGMFGDRLLLEGLRELMHVHEGLHVYLDDSHGMSWCGSFGAGSLVDVGLPIARTFIATSLGKGFGCAGGLLAVPDEQTKQRIEDLGTLLRFSQQLPPPVLGAIVASTRIHASTALPPLQRELADRLTLANRLLRVNRTISVRLAVRQEAPTPIHFVILGGDDEALAATRVLLDKGYMVSPVVFPAVPGRSSGIRFTIGRGHTDEDVRGLLAAIEHVILEERGAAQALRRVSVAI